MPISKTLMAASLAIAILSVPLAALAGGRPQGGHGGMRHHGGSMRHHGGGHHGGGHHVPSHRGFHRPAYGYGFNAPYYGYGYPRQFYGYGYPRQFYGGGYGYFGGYYGGSYGGSYGSITYYASPMESTPATVYAPTIVYPPAQSYYGSLSVAPVAPPPARPTVVEFATGRYELRGDGLSMPYTWVWIPNPPPPPEVEPAPAPPAPQSAPPPRASVDRAPRKSQLYRWIDAQGVVHLTDNPENVPEDQRAPARRPF